MLQSNKYVGTDAAWFCNKDFFYVTVIISLGEEGADPFPGYRNDPKFLDR